MRPRGRTGLAGRGLLGLWGSNLSVAALVVRANPDTGHLQILLGGKEGATGLGILKGFVLPDEAAEDTVRRVLAQEAGWELQGSGFDIVFEGSRLSNRLPIGEKAVRAKFSAEI